MCGSPQAGRSTASSPLTSQLPNLTPGSLVDFYVEDDEEWAPGRVSDREIHAGGVIVFVERLNDTCGSYVIELDDATPASAPAKIVPFSMWPCALCSAEPWE